MKTLCLGGSFNPIHHGHLICTRAVAEARGYQKVVLIPSGQPPHKPRQTELADASDRLHMCRLALSNSSSHASNPQANPHLSWQVLDLELTRTGPSYTIDTVRELRRRGWPEVHWLIGADMLNYLPNWHEAAALLREATFLTMARPGVPIDWDALPPAWVSVLKQNVVEAPLIEISSTMIRQRVRAGQDISYLTSPEVVDYIHAKNLYKDG